LTQLFVDAQPHFLLQVFFARSWRNAPKIS